MNVLKNRLFISVALGHTTIDVFNSSGPVLVVFLSAMMGLTNAQVGLAASLYAMVGAVGQPIFGWLADRYGGRWMAGLSVLWTISFIVLATITAGAGQFLWLIIPYALAACGSAAFHPIGTASSTVAGGRKAATATALFFLFGQIGLATGPALSGYLLQEVGLDGWRYLSLIAIPVILLLLTATYPTGTRNTKKSKSAENAETPSKTTILWGAIILVALLSFTRAWAQLGTITFVPKLFQDKGWSPAMYGAITGVMWLSSGIMGVVAGYVADRRGRRQTIFWAMALSVIPLYFLPISDGWQAFVLAMLVGGLTGAPHSIIIVVAQSLLPGQRAMVSGVALGFVFAMGAVASLCIGWLADVWSLTAAMQLSAAVAAASALLALVLPQTRGEVQQVTESGAK